MVSETGAAGAGEGTAASSVMNVQRRWLGLFRRLLGLQGSPGGMRYVITITVIENEFESYCDWTVQPGTRVER